MQKKQLAPRDCCLQDPSEVSGGTKDWITPLLNHNLIKSVFFVVCLFVCLKKVGVCAEEILVKIGSNSLSTEILQLLPLDSFAVSILAPTQTVKQKG